ncbi:protein kinase [Pseudomonas phoenicis]|uniref:protein kinase n=1 Tax=unclassified Pseudomonas TaxID=196821 RepID=UPI0039A0981E
MHTLDDLHAGRLHGVTRLDLSAQLSEFPPEIFELADSLEVLNLTGNQLSSLPHDLHRLKRLKVLFCSHNRFIELPHGLDQCTQLHTLGFRNNRIAHVDEQALPPGLRALILTDNALTTLPDALGACRHLQKLMLTGNRLEALPESLERCQGLELLRIANNRLPALPDWLLRMPRLAWLAYAGNPLPVRSQTPAADKDYPQIPWSALTLQAELGRGASGVVHQASWAGRTAPVAVKLYKGAITSDGSPQAEMDACLAAADHPNLVEVLGRVVDHPEQVPALVMHRIDSHWRNLGGPPSLDSCTRDRYDTALRLGLPALLRLLAGVASAAAHLHAQGLLHGDLYAHNILFAPNGQCLLTDFGAASFYPAGEASGQALEALEVRAFGILMQELLSLEQPLDAELHALTERCMQATGAQRPRFAHLAAALSQRAASAQH